MIRVALADDHPVVREGFRRILEQSPDFQVVGEAADAASAVELSRRVRPDVLLMDVSMPGARFADTLGEILRSAPGVRVLVVSVYPAEQLAVRALAAGAHGYLAKDRSPEELADAIRTVHAGGRHPGHAADAAGSGSFRRSGRVALQDLLSPRELEIFLQLGAGRTIKQIADATGLSPKTVSTYRARALEKTHLSGRAEIIRFVIESGLLE